MPGTTVTVQREWKGGAYSSGIQDFKRAVYNDLKAILVDLVALAASATPLAGSAVYDPPSLVDGAGTTTTVTVTGAVLGDFAQASFSLTTSGITITAWVSAADTVSVRFQNESGGTLDIASGTLRALVTKQTVSTSPAITAFDLVELDIS